MYLTLLGLILDALGAVLLIIGELKQHAGFLNYRATGEQQEHYRGWIGHFPWWKRWALHMAFRFGSKHDMGQDRVEDSFAVTVWGLVLLIAGFFFQALGAMFS